MKPCGCEGDQNCKECVVMTVEQRQAWTALMGDPGAVGKAFKNRLWNTLIAMAVACVIAAVISVWVTR